MENATLTISLPRPMKNFILSKMREGRFSTPSEYIRSLIRHDQDLNGQGDMSARARSPESSEAAPRVRQEGTDHAAAVGKARNSSGSKNRGPSVRGR